MKTLTLTNLNSEEAEVMEMLKIFLANCGVDPRHAEYFQHKLGNLRPTRRHPDGQSCLAIGGHYFKCCRLPAGGAHVIHMGVTTQYGTLGDPMGK